MAEDKRVRIVADTSPLRQIREEALSLYRDIDQASALNNQAIEKNLDQLREQLSLMEDRNELEKMLIELRRQAQELNITPSPSKPIVPSQQEEPFTPERSRQEEREPQREPIESTEPLRPTEERKPSTEYSYPEEPPAPTGERPRTREVARDDSSVEWEVIPEEPKPKKKKGRSKKEEDFSEESSTTEEESKPRIRNINREILTEINKHVENIDNSITNVDRSQKNVDESKTIVDKRETLEEHVVNIERSVENVQENTRILSEKDPVETTTPLEERREQRRKERSDTSEDNNKREVLSQPTIINFDDSGIIQAIGGVETAVTSSKRDVVDAIKDIKLETPKEVGSTTLNEARTLSTIADILSRIEDSVLNIEERSVSGNGGDNNIVPPIQPRPAAPGSNDPTGLLMGGGLGRLFGGIAILSLLNQVKGIASERYFRNADAGQRAEYQSTAETGANYTRVRAANEADKYRWIPFIGDILARGIEQPANILADKMLATFQKYQEAEPKFTSYAQVLGRSNDSAMSEVQREGGYAARALGMDYATYGERRAQLIRAGGGRFPGGTEFDPTARNEDQSLMAVQQLYGLSSSTVDRLQGSMRFGDENRNYGGSAVISLFERTMKELQLPLSEIAATMGESLETFNKQADQILSKAGDFDAGKVAAVLSGIRAATGFQGRQLERTQEALSGGSLSKDEVTQALLFRALSKGENAPETYTEAQARLEKVQEDPELMRDFLLDLKSLTQNNEQFMNVVKAAFTNLSYNDVRDLFANETDLNASINGLFDKVGIKQKEIDENPRAAYEPDAGAATVGPAARMTSSDTNRQIGQGKRSIEEILESIEKGVVKISSDTSILEELKTTLSTSWEQILNLKDFATGEAGVKESGQKASLLILQQMASWTRLMNKVFTLGVGEDK